MDGSGYNYMDIEGALFSLEVERGWLQSSRTCYIAKNQVVSQDLVSFGALFASDRRLPSLKLRNVMQLLRHRQTRMITMAAKAWRFIPGKQSMRAFYPDRRVSLKLVHKDSNAARSMIREIEQRQIVEPLDIVLLPRMLAHGQIGDYLWQEEELVFGRRFTYWIDTARFCQNGLSQLTALYAKTRAEDRPMLSYYIDRDLPIDVPDDFLAARQRAFAENPMIPMAQVHGDISAANVAVWDKKIIFMDWEDSHVGALLRDCLHLTRRTREGSAKILKASLRELAPFYASSKVMSHELVMFFASAMADDPARMQEYYKLWREGESLIQSSLSRD